MPQPKTLDRALSRAGLGSRSQAAAWIAEGRVSVNGRRVRDPDLWVDLDRDRIALDGRAVRAAARIYLALNKPIGFVTTRKDERGRATIYDLLPELASWVAPVGRLDRDSRGLLLLTNDTDLADHITDPRHALEKVYAVEASTLLSDEQLDQLRRGVELADGATRPARVKRLPSSRRRSRIEIAIHEGRNRQVRRMLLAIGSRVVDLERVAIGPVRLGSLAPRACRPLEPAEVAALRDALGVTRAERRGTDRAPSERSRRYRARKGSRRLREVR